MNALARAGWLLSAAFFALVLSSIVHIPHAGVVPEALILVVAITAAVRPAAALGVVALITPVAGVVAANLWNGGVLWPEVLVCAVLTGMSIDAARVRRHLDASLAAPASIFATIVIASMIASMGVVALRLGPSFTDALWVHLSREHFVDFRGFPAIFTGLRLVEGILLFALAARRGLTSAALRRLIAAAVTGAAIAGVMNLQHLIEVAGRSEAFWTSLLDLAQRFRWNVHYADFNAAGSYFVLALLLAVGLVLTSAGLRRAAWIAGAACIAIALWLTSSRVAFLAGTVAAGLAFALPYFSVGRARAVRAILVSTAAIVLLLLVAVALPQRGNQRSSLLAADVRLGLLETGGRMIATHPAFGIGLGEFYQRSGEFSSPELLAKFPAAVHENAHNNFLQIAAELGLVGGLAFTWLIAAALLGVAGTLGASHQRCQPLLLAGLGAFVITCVGGHPLLVAEPAFIFWTLLGAVAGSAAAAQPETFTKRRWWTVAACAAILIAVPWRMQAMLQDADLEHIGIGVSSAWQMSPDGVRYRDAEGHATLFVPTGVAIKFSVNPRTTTAVRLEIRLAGRVADVVSLAPGTWNDLTLPARTERASSRYIGLDLRVLDDDRAAIWITKVQPIQ